MTEHVHDMEPTGRYLEAKRDDAEPLRIPILHCAVCGHEAVTLPEPGTYEIVFRLPPCASLIGRQTWRIP